MGVEEEYQIVDAETLELRSFMTKILDRARDVMGDSVKSETHECNIEGNTVPCRTAAELRAEILRLRGTVAGLLAPHNLTILAAGTNPISSWADQQITALERPHRVIEETQDVSRRLVIFGLHVHIGIPDKDIAIQIMNSARYLLPHYLAISSSSPFWAGRLTGLKSYRPSVWLACPRSGLPPSFASRADFDRYIELLVKTNCIDNGRKVWWDMRPHPHFDTLEFRICDMATRVDETVALACLMQATVVKFYQMALQHLAFNVYPSEWIAENKWRAQRWGMDGKFVDFPRKTEVDVRRRVLGMLEFVDDVVDDLGSRQAVDVIRRVCETGSSADRQLAVHRDTQDLKAVAAHIHAETFEGVQILEPVEPVRNKGPVIPGY
jgi:carboxylate-amine ligase